MGALFTYKRLAKQALIVTSAQEIEISAEKFEKNVPWPKRSKNTKFLDLFDI